MAMNLHKGDNVNRLHSKVIDTIPYIFKHELLNNKTIINMTKITIAIDGDNVTINQSVAPTKVEQKVYICGANKVILFDTFIKVILDDNIVFITTYEDANGLSLIDLINLVAEEYNKYVEDVYNSFI